MLQDGHNVAIVEGLRCQSVNDGGDVNLTGSKELLILEFNNLGISLLLQEIDVGRIGHLSEDLEVWINPLNSFIDED